MTKKKETHEVGLRDKVMTKGGIVGKISSINGTTVVVKSVSSTIRVHVNAIEEILTKAKPVISTLNFDQHQIIRDIQKLYVPEGFELDPTYSKGVFYKGEGIIDPPLKYDLYPINDQIKEASADELPFADNSISSIMFDPPFMAGYTKEKDGKTAVTGEMGTRFHGFRYVKDIWKWYDQCLVEFTRILKPGGILAFKCQDTVSSGRNWFSHTYVMNKAVEKGLYPKDMFVLAAKNRMIGTNHGNQKHARKFHSYFWVFEKTSRVPFYFTDTHDIKIDYNISHNSIIDKEEK